MSAVSDDCRHVKLVRQAPPPPIWLAGRFVSHPPQVGERHPAFPALDPPHAGVASSVAVHMVRPHNAVTARIGHVVDDVAAPRLPVCHRWLAPHP
jgi:hypothetical protein